MHPSIIAQLDQLCMQSATVHFCLDGRGFDLAGRAGQPVIVMAEDDTPRTEQRALLGNGLGQRALNGLAVDIAAPATHPRQRHTHNRAGRFTRRALWRRDTPPAPGRVSRGLQCLLL